MLLTARDINEMVICTITAFSYKFRGQIHQQFSGYFNLKQISSS